MISVIIPVYNVEKYLQQCICELPGFLTLEPEKSVCAMLLYNFPSKVNRGN